MFKRQEPGRRRVFLDFRASKPGRRRFFWISERQYRAAGAFFWIWGVNNHRQRLKPHQNQPLNCKIRPRPRVVFAIDQVKHRNLLRQFLCILICYIVLVHQNVVLIRIDPSHILTSFETTCVWNEAKPKLNCRQRGSHLKGSSPKASLLLYR